jgi:hypothetical protein
MTPDMQLRDAKARFYLHILRNALLARLISEALNAAIFSEDLPGFIAEPWMSNESPCTLGLRFSTLSDLHDSLATSDPLEVVVITTTRGRHMSFAELLENEQWSYDSSMALTTSGASDKEYQTAATDFIDAYTAFTLTAHRLDAVHDSATGTFSVAPSN